MKRVHSRIAICIAIAGVWIAACTVPSGLTPPPITLEDGGELYETDDASVDSEPPADGEVIVEASLEDTAVASDANHQADASDAGVIDSGAADTGISDTGVVDTGVADSGVVDSGVADSGVADSGVLDSGAPVDAADGG